MKNIAALIALVTVGIVLCGAGGMKLPAGDSVTVGRTSVEDGGIVNDGVRVDFSGMLTTGEVIAGPNITVEDNHDGTITISAASGEIGTSALKDTSTIKWATNETEAYPSLVEEYALSTHNHDGTYLPLNGTAANSSQLGGHGPEYYATEDTLSNYIQAIPSEYLKTGEVLAGTNVTVTDNGDGTITVNATGGSGGANLSAFKETTTITWTTSETEAYPNVSHDYAKDHVLAGTAVTVVDNLDGTVTVNSTASGATINDDDTVENQTWSSSWIAKQLVAYGIADPGSYVAKSGDTMEGELTVPKLLLRDYTGLTSIGYTTTEVSTSTWNSVSTPFAIGGVKKSATNHAGLWIVVMRAGSTSAVKAIISYDDGITWSNLTYFTTMYTTNDVCYVGGSTWVVCGQSTSGNNRIWRTTDDGSNWSEVYSIADAYQPLSMACDLNGNIVATIYSGSSQSRFLRSTDNGASFTMYSTLPVTVAANKQTDIDCNQSTGTFIIIVDTNTGFCRSTNGGSSWTGINTGLSTVWVSVASSHNGYWIATINGAGAPYRSSDDGETWGAASAITGCANAMSIASNNGSTWRVGGKKSSSNEAATFVSYDNGTSWSYESSSYTSSTAGYYTGIGFSRNGTYITVDQRASGNLIRLVSGARPTLLLDGRGGGGGVAMLGINSGSATALHIDTVTGLVTYSSSSLRFKDDVRPYIIEWDKFMSLKPITYTERSTGFKGKHGLAAEWTAPLYPGEVPMDAQGKPFSVDYERIAGSVAVAAIQDLKRENDELKRRIEALERQHKR